MAANTGTSRNPNPPIRGHELVNEGHIRSVHVPFSDQPRVSGGCRCGARPEDFPNLTVNDMKRWHRQHKAEIRAAAT